MIGKTLLRLVCLCLVLAMTVTVNTLVMSAEEPLEETTKIAVVTADVERGDRLNAKNVELVEVKTKGLPDNVITNIDDVYGKVAAEKLYAGECLYPAKVTNKSDVTSNEQLLLQTIKKSADKFVVVTDYIPANSGEDVTTHLQALIDKNGSRTIYFPDGEYIISSSLKTSANPKMSTTLFFSPNAVLKASDNWSNSDGKNALVSIGGDYKGGDHINDNTSIGSYFGVFGGIFECNGKTDGISIVSGRESIIYGCTIINPQIGIEICYGANSSSSDADIENVTIHGSKKATSIGIHAIGNDNSITNVKIYDMEIGIRSTGINSFKNIQCIQTGTPDDNPYYDRTIGIESCGWILDCYVENTAIAYRFIYSILVKEVVSGLVASWTHPYKTQTAFEWITYLNSAVVDCRAEFYDASTQNTFIKLDGTGSKAVLDAPALDSTKETDGTYKKYLNKKGWIELAD